MRAAFSLALLIAVTAAQAEQLSNAPTSSIGYPSVATALTALRAKPGVNVSSQSGWTIVEDRAALTIWSFTPADHPAHPAVFRRTVSEKDGGVFVQTDGLCEGTKAACDKLMVEFQELNNRMREALEKKRPAR